MYSLVLSLHSLLRWIVLILAVVAVARALVGWLGKKEWARLDDQLGLFLSISIDLQLLLGLLLYIVLSPITRSAIQDFGAAMSSSAARFWVMEHALGMIVAVVLIHVGRSAARRGQTDASKHRRAAIWFGLAALAILITMPWPFLPYGRPLLRLPG